MDNAPLMVGVGSPLIDLVLQVDDAFLEAHVPGAKGGMEYAEAPAIAAMVAAAGGEAVRSPGGAAANTTAGVGALGIPTAFLGSAGDDEHGRLFEAGLRARGCEPRLVTSDLPTGHVLSLVTPDAERTMRTCLGAAVALDPAAVTAECFQGSKLVMLEGYTLFNHDLTRAVASAAKEAGCALALDLASFEVVEVNRPVLEELLSGQVDIVFANEDEARAWSGSSDELAALRDLASRCSVAVVKVGADGAWVRSGDEEHHVPAETVENVVDTTGAGDTWAAGFLAGWLRGAPLDECARLGAMAGAAVVQIPGALVPGEAWAPIRGRLDAWA